MHSRVKLTLLLPLLISIASASPLVGCNKLSIGTVIQKGLPDLRPGQAAFEFEPRSIHQLKIISFDSVTNKQWMAIFQKEAGQWIVASSPADQPTIDSLANSKLIEHLLDSLTTMKAVPNPQNGRIERFGLQPARYALEWSSSDQTYELRLGTETTKPLPFGRYMQTDAGVQKIATGSIIGLIKKIDEFKQLRLLSWTPHTPDDIDEVQVRRNGKQILTAQRQGTDWVDSHKKKIEKDIHQFLETITYFKVNDILEDSNSIQQGNASFSSSPALYEVQLTPRLGNPFTLKIQKTGNRLLGNNSAREGVYFLLGQRILQAFE